MEGDTVLRLSRCDEPASQDPVVKLKDAADSFMAELATKGLHERFKELNYPIDREQYLNRLHLSLGQAAYLLGFSEQSSFFRACKRWFGLPPGEYRRQLHHAAQARR